MLGIKNAIRVYFNSLWSLTSSHVQVMARSQTDTKPLPKTMLTYWQWDDQDQWNLNQDTNILLNKMSLKMLLTKWPAFCLSLNVLTKMIQHHSWTHQGLGSVSLAFLKLSKTLSQNLCIAEIELLMKISSWNFVCVPKACFWANIQNVSAWNFHHICDFWHRIFSWDYFGEFAKR